jgi:Histidyl-tRNA synthetase
VPACGFSLGLERIIVVMTERGMFPPSVVTSAVDIVVTFLDDGSRAEALKLAGELRAAKYRVDVFPEASRKFDKPLKYASARGARAMAIFGENEVPAARPASGTWKHESRSACPARTRRRISRACSIRHFNQHLAFSN